VESSQSSEVGLHCDERRLKRLWRPSLASLDLYRT
jgi:hypothetical protein